MPKTTIAAIADTHCGSTLGLCPPVVTLDNGAEYHYSKAQEWLWDRYTNHYVPAVKKAKRNGASYLIINGDLVDGKHHGTTQILSGNPGAQAEAFLESIDKLRALKFDHIFVIRGTEAHGGPAGSSEEALGEAIGAERDPDTGNRSWFVLRFEIDGVRFDFRHHGRAGGRPWTEGSVVTYLAHQIWMEHARREIRHPDVAVRAHVHRYADSHDVTPTRAIVLPSWQIKTSFAHKVATESIADIGGLILTVKDGEFSSSGRKHLYQPTGTTVWRPQQTL